MKMEIAPFKLLHMNCMVMSRNIKKLGEKLYRKLSDQWRNEREWADNAALPATSNTFHISIEILNGSDRIPSNIILPIYEESIASPKILVFGYVSTKFYEPFPSTLWGWIIAYSF